jgi:D-alanyl-D-alanine carboxypeptidase
MTPVTTGHLFGIGSITKTFVAVVALQLVEEGRLGLEQTPQEILGPEVTGEISNADQATIGQLLNHTSGIPSWEDDPDWIREGRGDKNKVGRIWGRTDTLDYLDGVPPTNKPGERFSYANTNHTLLGLIIEKITGNDIVDEIANRILIPVGIQDIYLEGFQAVPVDRLANRYHYATPEFKRDAGVHADFPEVAPGLIDASASNLSVEWTAGGMVVTASDLAIYAAAYRAGALLTPESMAYAQDWLQIGESDYVGHGLFYVQQENMQIIGHSGSVLGYTGAMFWDETGDIAVAVVTNVGTMHIGQDLPGAWSVVIDPHFWELVLMLSD